VATIKERRARAAARRAKQGKEPRKPTAGEANREVRELEREATLENEEAYLHGLPVTSKDQKSLQGFMKKKRR
jgi:hypothetical protein